MRLAFKVAYIGHGHHGYQRQPGLRTIEGDLLDSLIRIKAIEGPRESRFQSASRTDRGTSALGNVIAFDTDLHPKDLISMANSQMDGIWLYASTRTEPAFNPRKAVERWYRYYMPGTFPVEKLEEVTPIFLGTHDFRAFSKKGEVGKCDVGFLRLQEAGNYCVMDIKANRFLWNMVRAIAGSLQMYAEGEVQLGDLQRALQGEDVGIRPGTAHRLFLMDVSYGLEFQWFTGRGLREELKQLSEKGHLEALFLDMLLSRTGVKG